MRSRRPTIESLITAITRSHYKPAIEGTAIGLALGLIDVHSKDGDWFNALVAYLLAGFVLGIIHAGRAWQAWPPLGWSFYLMHRAAIAYGYRPPYVEENGAAALVSLFVLWPAGFGLGIGASLRFVFSTLDRVTARAHPPTSTNDGAAAGKGRLTGRQMDVHHVPLLVPTTTRSEVARPRRSTVARMMVIVAVVSVHLATMRALVFSEPFFGFSTFYSDQYSDSAFNSLRVGMTHVEVEAIAGRPLRKAPSSQTSGINDEEMWFYSDRPDPTSNFWRRWVFFKNGKVVTVINDFWVE
jgi:hypothetical protein